MPLARAAALYLQSHCTKEHAAKMLGIQSNIRWFKDVICCTENT